MPFIIKKAAIILIVALHSLLVSNTSVWADKALPPLAKSLPANEATNIHEQQVFLVRANGAISGKNFIEHVFCEVEGVSSVNTVRIISGERKAELLRDAGISDKENWIAFRCAQQFPAGADVIVRWDSPSASTFQAEDYLRFKVRSGDWLKLTCSRENAKAACNPLASINLLTERDLKPQDLAKFYLKDDAGKSYLPDNSANDTNGGSLTFGRLPPLKHFTLVVPPNLKEIGTETPLVVTQTYRIRTGDFPPLVKFSRSFGIIEKQADPALPITVRNLEPDQNGKATAATLRMLRVTSEQDMIHWYGRTLALQKVDHSMSDNKYDYTEIGDRKKNVALKENEDARTVSLLKGNKQARTLSLPKPGGPKEFEVVGLPLPDAGLYVVEVESSALGTSLLDKKSPMFVRTIALVTNLAVHVKTNKTGKENAFVWVTRLNDASVVSDASIHIRDCKGSELASGKTDRDGSARLKLKKTSGNCPLFVFAQAGDDLAFTRSDWDEGLESWRFNLPWNSYYGDDDSIDSMQLHTVLARNLVRTGETVHMKHYARIQQRFGVVASDNAKLPQSIDIINEGNNERSNIPLNWNNRGNALTELRLPANAKRGHYRIAMAGRTTGRFTVADFRLPVYKAEVSTTQTNIVGGDSAQVDVRLSFLSGGPAGGDLITARSRIDTFNWDGFEEWSDYSFSSPNENEESSEPLQGQDQQVALSATGSARIDLLTPSIKQPHTLLTDVEYSDPNGEIYTAQTRSTIWPASVLIGIKARDWAMAREKLHYDIITTDVNGKSIGNVPFKVMGIHHQWDTYRKRNIGGFYSYEWNKKSNDLGLLCQGVSDRSGRYSCESTVESSGEVQLIAKVTDKKGRSANAITTIWATNGKDWIFRVRGENSDRIDLLPEKKRYQAGEKARFQVRMPFREATALITVEREGTVLSSFVTKLSGKSAVIEVPVNDDWAPNVYVSALLVRGRVGDPAPTATVDLAKPAFKLGIAHIDINWQRYSLDVTVNSDKSEYQTREAAQVRVKVLRTEDKRPAANSELTVFAIDEALLELQGNTSWKLLDAMMKRRDYGMTTATAQMQVVGKRHFGRKALPPGGSGGRGAATRELFDTLVLWRGNVLTDSNGEANIEVPLNDSLTRFRIVAVADSDDSNGNRFGTGETSVRTTRDLQLFSGLPATVRHGDDFRAMVTLRNTTTRTITALVSSDLNGTPLDNKEQRIGAGETVSVSWNIKAPANGKEAVWNFTAVEKGKTRGDALRIRQSLQTPLLVSNLASASSDVIDVTKLSLKPKATLIPGSQAELTVSLARVYGSDTSAIRAYFARYPFDCLEQRMTKAMGVKDEKLWEIISESLPNYLSSNGLANYYPGDSQEGYPTLTAFVLAGAAEAGWTLPKDSRERMLSGLERYVAGQFKAQRTWLPNDNDYLLTEKLIVLEALSRYDRASRRLFDTVRVDPAKLTAASLVDWLDILNRTKDVPDHKLQRATAIKALRNNINIKFGIADIQRSDDRWYFMRSDDFTVARLFRASLDTSELSEFKIPLLKSLNNRMGLQAHFYSTQANLWAAFAMERYNKQAAASGRTRITYNNQSKEVIWGAETYEDSITFPWNPAASGEVHVEHIGKGQPWVRAQLNGAVALTGPVNNGITLHKKVSFVQQRNAGRYSVGDIVRVTVTANNAADLGWLAIDDPIPAGATVLGGLSKLADTKDAAHSYYGYRYIERSFTNVRASFEWVTKGTHSFSYELRLTTPGRFTLPSTYSEAMYVPEINGLLSNAVFEIDP